MDHIFPFLWMRGESEETLRNEIGRIQDCGIQSFCLEARPHPDFCGPGWWRDLDVVVDEAGRRGMSFWILDDAHFPTGYANGAIKERYPDRRKVYLRYNTADVYPRAGGFSLHVQEMLTPRLSFLDIGRPVEPEEIRRNRLVAVLGVRMQEGSTLSTECMDVTDEVRDGWLHLSLPQGAWRIYVVYTTHMGGGREDYINLLDEDSVRVLIDAVYEPHYEHLRQYAGTLFRGFFSDEPELGNVGGYDGDERVGHRDMPLPWADGMEDELQAIWGTTWRCRLPYLWADCATPRRAASTRFGYMDLITRRVGRCFSQQIGDWCRERGLAHIGHLVEDNHQDSKCGSGTGHYYRAMEGMSMAGIDVIRDQIVPGGGRTDRRLLSVNNSQFYHYVLGRMGSSCAALDPNKAGRCMCELYGAYGWHLGVRDMTWIMNHLLSRGVNYYVPHAFSMAQYPDPDCPPHFYAGGNNAQYRDFATLMQYTQRAASLLSDGRHPAHVALLYQAEAEWSGDYMSLDEPARLLTEHQIDFSILPMDALTTDRYGTVHTGNGIEMQGSCYDEILIPYMEYIPEALVRCICESSGTHYVFLGDYPREMLEDTPDAAAGAADETWAADLAAHADCLTLTALREQLRQGFLRELSLGSDFADLAYYHYRKAGDIYVLFNESLYDTYCGPVDLGTTEPVYRYDAWRDCLTAWDGNLRIAPYEMVILVTRRQVEAMNVPVQNKTGRGHAASREVLDLSDGWQVSMVRARQYPDYPPAEEMGTLHPISEQHPAFSGIIRYERAFCLDRTVTALTWSAEHVYECARIYVDGVYCGGALTPPYEVRMEGAWKPGKHRLTVEVSTSMAREQALYPAPPFRVTYDALEPTGMFGRVRLMMEE